MGGLASEGLRLPSLKSDVHSTCWFFKQLCPLKKEEGKKKKGQAAHPKFAEELGAGKGGGGVMEPELTDSVSLSLTLSLLISVVARLFF